MDLAAWRAGRAMPSRACFRTCLEMTRCTEWLRCLDSLGRRVAALSFLAWRGCFAAWVFWLGAVALPPCGGVAARLRFGLQAIGGCFPRSPRTWLRSACFGMRCLEGGLFGALRPGVSAAGTLGCFVPPALTPLSASGCLSSCNPLCVFPSLATCCCLS